MDRKKQRGQRRKLKTMFKYIDSFVPFSEAEQDFEHFHVPSDTFIESLKTSGKVKTAFCRKWLETTEKFINQKNAKQGFCKIVAMISVPNYWLSEIIIFYDESYYDSFWNRNGSEQFWTIAQGKKSFCKERNINTSLREMCYNETVIEEDGTYKRALWFYGDLPLK